MLHSFLSSHSLHEPLQSGFRAAHSAETALVKVSNDILTMCDQDSLCLLVLLNLSAAFDTVDHSILLHRLSSHLNLQGSVLDWFRSSVSHRLHFVAANGFSSTPRTVSLRALSSVPSSSPSTRSPCGDIICRHGVNFHMYADDTQLLLSASPLNSRTTGVLTDCLSDMKSWTRDNFLQLNVSKTEALLIGSRQRLRTSSTGSISLHGCTLTLTEPVRNLGVLFDPELSFLPHTIRAMTGTAYHHLRNIARLHHRLTPQVPKPSTTHLSPQGSITGTPSSSAFPPLPFTTCRSPKPLQLMYSHAPDSPTPSPSPCPTPSPPQWPDPITPTLARLHRLTIPQRIEYKILVLTFKAIHGLAPSYLSDLLTPYQPAAPSVQPRRSMSPTRPDLPSVACAPTLWNSIPRFLPSLRPCPSSPSHLCLPSPLHHQCPLHPPPPRLGPDTSLFRALGRLLNVKGTLYMSFCCSLLLSRHLKALHRIHYQVE
uniref:Reverse transcriptase domain-containing protein n=1 Tax=Callorhinchus milii TaxID=7868 RepID=A0A4W3GWS9_CALMI